MSDWRDDSRVLTDEDDRLYLACPIAEKDEVKDLGARWDNEARFWFIPSNLTFEADTIFSRWQPRMLIRIQSSFEDKDLVKSLGARWHSKKKTWFVPPGVDARRFERWTTESSPAEERVEDTPTRAPVARTAKRTHEQSTEQSSRTRKVTVIDQSDEEEEEQGEEEEIIIIRRPARKGKLTSQEISELTPKKRVAPGRSTSAAAAASISPSSGRSARRRVVAVEEEEEEEPCSQNTTSSSSSSRSQPKRGTCPVCLSPRVDRVLSCGHVYCERDALRLKQSGQPCAVCRKPVAAIIPLFL